MSKTISERTERQQLEHARCFATLNATNVFREGWLWLTLYGYGLYLPAQTHENIVRNYTSCGGKRWHASHAQVVRSDSLSLRLKTSIEPSPNGLDS